jgi:hypothetical protein
MSPFGLSPKASAGLMGVVLIQGRSLTERTVGERGSRKEAGRVKLNELMLERGKPKRRRHSIRAPDAKQSKATGARSERRGKRTGRISRRGGGQTGVPTGSDGVYSRRVRAGPKHGGAEAEIDRKRLEVKRDREQKDLKEEATSPAPHPANPHRQPFAVVSKS